MAAKRALYDSFHQALEMASNTKPNAGLQLVRSARVLNANYVLELLLPAGIATFGLVLNSPAVVIGAMLISPLMGPIPAAGLAFAASDLCLGLKSLPEILGSVVTAVLFFGISRVDSSFSDAGKRNSVAYAAECAGFGRGVFLRACRLSRGMPGRPLDNALREVKERALRSRLGVNNCAFVFDWRRGPAR